MDPEEIEIEDDLDLLPPSVAITPLLSAVPSMEPPVILPSVDHIRTVMGFNNNSNNPLHSFQKGQRFITSTTLKTKPCFSWQRGTCFRGDSCRYLHDGPGGNNGSNNVNGVNGGRKSVYGSGFIGACFNFRDTGLCERGDACKYSHNNSTISGGGGSSTSSGSKGKLSSPGCLEDPWENLSGRTMVEAHQYHMSLMPMLSSGGGGGNKRSRNGSGGRSGENRRGGGRGRWQRR